MRLLVNHFTFFADDLLALFLADGFADLDVVVPASAAAENGFEVDNIRTKMNHHVC